MFRFRALTLALALAVLLGIGGSAAAGPILIASGEHVLRRAVRRRNKGRA